MNYWTQSEKNIFVAAHRGWCDKYPENTMLAFRKALEVGVDQIETDVRITADGELVCIHDDSVDRTTNGSGKVCELTLAELQKNVVIVGVGNHAEIWSEENWQAFSDEYTDEAVAEMFSALGF